MSLRECLQERILILDGAMGTLIQQENLSPQAFHRGHFARWKVALAGNNDVLNLTDPQVIGRIHQRYVDAGADIISTNTFSANRISQKEYACEDMARQMALEGARIARRVADGCKERKIWVAGSMGPTSKSLSLASDMSQPTYRPVDFDELSAAYKEQAEALLEGGADVLLLETCYDALNAKAALYAISQLNDERGIVIPVMVSATVNDRSGRLLTGQTLEAFYTSIAHYPILSIGLNCSFGVTDLCPFVERLAALTPAYISLHPNAGLPNEMGEYEELPEYTAHHLRTMAKDGLLNIAGGCCGTDDRHIRAIADALRGIKPRQLPQVRQTGDMNLSGLDAFTIHAGVHQASFTNVGERTNVAGSRKFARLIAEKKYEEAAQVARKQIEGGASIIDINMDDAMLDSQMEMRQFVRFIENDPAIASAVLMIDSSDWPTVLEGLKNAQGKCIVNSISLKGGEQDFVEKARELCRLGAATVVMAFDEQGQATTYERKIEIASRAYRLLTQIGFPPQDIIFDVNILSVGTGIGEHANYGIDFIRAVEWIKKNLPFAKTSGGVSNLSFAFRGNNVVREAMHSAFLYHAIHAGLDMGIVNPSMLQVYDEIEPHLLQAVEDVILNHDEGATERLMALAEKLKAQGTDSQQVASQQEGWRSLPLQERLVYALSKGIGDFLKEDIVEALHAYGDKPVEVIEKPLMQAMEHIGRLFGESKMFLPQVVKSAKIMKDAVTLLQPYMDAEKQSEADDNRPVVVLATAKGDVHDIGKNIVGIVLGCNNFLVHDLGVMVSNEAILEAAQAMNPVMVGVSGLITPSLKEMENLCRLFQQHHIQVPIVVGGATTSAVHTAVKLSPLYDYCVCYGGDASSTAVLAKKFQLDCLETIRQVKEQQQQICEAYEERHYELTPYAESNAQAPHLEYIPDYTTIGQLKPYESLTPTIAEVEPYIDWRMFLLFWGFKGESLSQQLVNPEAAKTLREGKAWLQRAVHDGILRLQMLLRFEEVRSRGNDILFADGSIMPMLRSQLANRAHLCLSDYFDASQPRPMGLFCIVADENPEVSLQHDDALMSHAIRARLAEAAAVWMQQTIYGDKKCIRPAFGYASCPDHSLKRLLFDRLEVEQNLPVSLNSSFSIQPSTTVCGLLIAHPEARYFPVGRIDNEQLADYCLRRGISQEEGEKQLSTYIVNTNVKP